jgi:hypothetical protein
MDDRYRGWDLDRMRNSAEYRLQGPHCHRPQTNQRVTEATRDWGGHQSTLRESRCQFFKSQPRIRQPRRNQSPPPRDPAPRGRTRRTRTPLMRTANEVGPPSGRCQKERDQSNWSVSSRPMTTYLSLRTTLPSRNLKPSDIATQAVTPTSRKHSRRILNHQ